MHSSIYVAVGALGTALATSEYPATVIESSTITVYSCGPNINCPGHYTGTSIVAVSSASVDVSTPCDTPVGSTLITSVAPPVVETSVAIPPASVSTASSVAPSSASPTEVAPSSVAPSAASSTALVSLSSTASIPVAPSTVVPVSSEVPVGPVFSNSTMTVSTNVGSETTGILTATGTPSVPSTSTSTSIVHITPVTQPTTGSAPSSTAPALNKSGRMVIPCVLMGLLALGACIFA